MRPCPANSRSYCGSANVGGLANASFSCSNAQVWSRFHSGKAAGTSSCVKTVSGFAIFAKPGTNRRYTFAKPRKERSRVLRGCGWDGGLDLVSRHAGNGGGARRFAEDSGNGGRWPAAAADSPSDGVHEARDAEWHETGPRDDGAATCWCKETSSYRRI
jgi:hypothetical protein